MSSIDYYPGDHSAAINRLIRNLAKEAHFRDVRFDQGILLASSTFEDDVAIAHTAAYAKGYLLIRQRGSDQRIPGLFFGDPGVEHVWAWAGGHSDSSWTNVIMDFAQRDEEMVEDFADTVHPAMERGLGANYRGTRSWWDGEVEGYGRIIAVHAGMESGGVAAYRSAGGLFLDYGATDFSQPDAG